MLVVILTGFFLGFIGSIPIAGPISVLVLALGLKSGFKKALSIAIGGAFAEGLYAFLAFWGFSNYLARYALVLPASRGITAIILLIIGIFLIRKRPSAEVSVSVNGNAARSGVPIGFAISILNPTLLLTWIAASHAVFSTHLVSFHAYEALPFSLGVMGGITGWFSLLLAIVGKYRNRFRPAVLDKVIYSIGLCIIAGSFVFIVLQVLDLFS